MKKEKARFSRCFWYIYTNTGSMVVEG